MKTLSFPQLLFASLGALLVWAAITGKTPAQVIKDAINNTNTPGATTDTSNPYSRPTDTPAGQARSAPFQSGGPGKAAI